MLKVKLHGWKDEELSIANRIETGFEELGHEVCHFNESVDISIAINPDFYDEAKNQSLNKNGILIYNILDVPEHLIDTYPIDDIKVKLKDADAITSISKSTQKQVKKYFKKQSKVVYTPYLEVEKQHKNRDIDFLYVGRASDPNKRFNLIHNAIIEAGISQSSLVVCGPEIPSCGAYAGVVPSSQLQELYNRAKILLLPSRIEGVGLSMIEAATVGTVPITCSDNPTAKEFGFKDFSCEPTSSDLARKMMFTLSDFLAASQKVNEIVEKNKLKEKFNRKNVAQRYINIYEDRLNSNSI